MSTTHNFLTRDAQINNNVHATIDLETLGNGNNAAVIEIGVAVFELAKRDEQELFTRLETRCWTLDVEEAMGLGDVNASTLVWWLSSPDITQSVRDRLHYRWNKKRTQVSTALRELNALLLEHTPSAVWANGATFDFIILRNLYAAARANSISKCKPVWGFRDEMCIRPLRRMYSKLWDSAREAAKSVSTDTNASVHSADYDCIINSVFLADVHKRVALTS